MKKAMIITVGTGETVSHGICCSIKQQNPNHIEFVLTEESKRITLPLILKSEEMGERKYNENILKNENDVEEIRFECKKIIQKIKKIYKEKDIVVDYTSGTKAMSVGLALAAIEEKVGTLVYVSGKRDKGGRVISGTERPLPIEPNLIYTDELFKNSIFLFNNYQFDSCVQILSQAKKLINESEFQKKINLMEKLALAYSHWDKFEINEAFEILKEISKKKDLFSFFDISPQKIKLHKEILYKEINNPFCKERIADLLENAKRRGDYENKYDDAIARLYRLIEYLAQIKIVQKGLYKQDSKNNPDTENLNIEKLPKSLQEKYLREKNIRDNKIKLGLVKSYELLYDLNDELGKIFMYEYNMKNSELKNILKLRNNSILAHGFTPIKKTTYKKCLFLIENFINKIFPEVSHLKEKVKFLNIKLREEIY